MKILIIANAHRNGGSSGSDEIYQAFMRHWPASFRLWQMRDIDFKPFWLCYVWRTMIGCLIAVIEPQRYDLVYSASDFMMDSLPAFIMKLRGHKWVAGFYMNAPRYKRIYFFTQKFIYRIIKRFADMVIVTNPTMFPQFEGKKKSWINGGIDLSLAGINDSPKEYHLVFCGRIHPTKGIDTLIDMWNSWPTSDYKLAIIGDGDLGIQYMKDRFNNLSNITFFGYLGKERFEVFKSSNFVLYPVPKEYDHFSMAPVEAMACGCPLVIAELTPVLKYFKEKMGMPIGSDFESYDKSRKAAYEWAQQFSWPLQTNRVWEDIQKCLF